MPRARLKFKSVKMVENYHKYLPLSKDHRITTSDHDSMIIVTTNTGTALAVGLSAVITHESHTIEDEEKQKKYDDVYYLRPEDVNWNLLKRSSTVTYCPFKGYATHYSSADKKDVAWSYDQPYEQVEKLRGLVAFYSQKVIINTE